MILLVPAFVATAAAAPDQGSRRQAAAASPAEDRQPFPVVDTLNVQTALAASSRVGRAKLTLRVPPTFAIAFGFLAADVKSRYFPPLDRQSLVYAIPEGWKPQRPDPACVYVSPVLPAWVWPVRVAFPAKADKPGEVTGVGVYPDVHVSFLAFGTLPAKATLRLRQTTGRDGRASPLTIKVFSGAKSVRKGNPTDFSDPGGCDERWEADLRATNNNPTLVTGSADLTVSEVSVDGRAVPVGNQCRTVTPLRLDLRGTAANGAPPDRTYSDVLGAGAVVQQRDRVRIGAAQSQVYPDSENLRIPTFTGCRSPDGDDISPLVTSMVSGDDNSLAVNIKQPDLLGDIYHPTVCSAGNPTCKNYPDFLRPPVPGK